MHCGNRIWLGWGPWSWNMRHLSPVSATGGGPSREQMAHSKRVPGKFTTALLTQGWMPAALGAPGPPRGFGGGSLRASPLPTSELQGDAPYLRKQEGPGLLPLSCGFWFDKSHFHLTSFHPNSPTALGGSLPVKFFPFYRNQNGRFNNWPEAISKCLGPGVGWGR